MPRSYSPPHPAVKSPLELRASQIEFERSEPPKIARQLQRSLASHSMTCGFKFHADHDGT
jgi:hypothetical protein